MNEVIDSVGVNGIVLGPVPTTVVTEMSPGAAPSGAVAGDLGVGVDGELGAPLVALPPVVVTVIVEGVSPLGTATVIRRGETIRKPAGESLSEAAVRC